MRQAAFLPLATIHVFVHAGRAKQQLLELPLGRVATGDLPALAHQAAINLAGCPAWQQAQLPKIWLWNAEGDYDPVEHRWTSEQRVQLLRAVAPLRHPHLTSFTLDVDGFELGQPEVAALQHSFGAGLTTLSLGSCTLVPTFWAAVNEHLPSVTELQLRSSVTCQASDVIIFCSRRPTAHPLTLHLGPDLYKACGGDQVQAGLRGYGVQHVSINECDD
jgi:hypothetical protein